MLIDSPSPFTKHLLSDAINSKVIGFRSENVVAKGYQAKAIEPACVQMVHATTNKLAVYDPLYSLFIANAIDLPNAVVIRCKDALLDDGHQYVPF